MSYTNGTPFLNLPQTIGSDHRDWFDTNESFLDLDTKVKTLWDDSGSAASAIDALEELTATLQTDLTTLSGTVDTHTSALSTINEALVLINGTLATLNTSVATKFDSAGIADPYDADHGIYAVDDVVTYNGQRYVCSTAVTAAEPFDADKWTAEDVQNVINALKSSLSTKPNSFAITSRQDVSNHIAHAVFDSTRHIAFVDVTFLMTNSHQYTHSLDSNVPANGTSYLIYTREYDDSTNPLNEHYPANINGRDVGSNSALPVGTYRLNGWIVF